MGTHLKSSDVQVIVFPDRYRRLPFSYIVCIMEMNYSKCPKIILYMLK